jgi:hypothetical protein
VENLTRSYEGLAAGSKRLLSGNQSTGKRTLVELMSWELKPDRLFPHWLQDSAPAKGRGITLTERSRNLGKRAVPRL